MCYKIPDNVEHLVNCPNCGEKDRVELDTHSDGFCEDLFECGLCGIIWTKKDIKVKALKPGRTRKHKDQGLESCPICHATGRIELSLHSDGYATNLKECGDCRAVWSAIGESVRILPNSKAIH